MQLPLISFSLACELHSNAAQSVYNPSEPRFAVNAPTWHVLGAGAMGCLFASRLTLADGPAVLILRAPTSDGTTTVTVEDGGSHRNFPLATSTANEQEYISHLLITTKAQNVVSAAESIGQRLDENSQVLVLSNGLGYADKLISTVPGSGCFFGATTEGAYRLGPKHIRYAGQGITRIGQVNASNPPEWFKHWSAAVNSQWSNNIGEILWHKFAINCAINPLTAVHRCLNGDLAEPANWREVEQICEEIAEVSALEGKSDAIGDLPREVKQVVEATANNRSSMLQDVLAGRPTEIQYLTGHLLQRAEHHGLHLPMSRALYERLLYLSP